MRTKFDQAYLNLFTNIFKKIPNRLVGIFWNNKTQNVLQHSYFQQIILTSTCRSMSMKSSFKLILSLQRSVTSQWTMSSLLTKCFIRSHMQGSSSLSILYLSVKFVIINLVLYLSACVLWFKYFKCFNNSLFCAAK